MRIRHAVERHSHILIEGSRFEEEPMRTALLATLRAASIAALLAPSSALANVVLTGTVRDFCILPGIPNVCAGHPDFENVPILSEPGIVEQELGADGKPVYAKGDGTTSPTTSGQESFDDWYNDVPGVNASAPLDVTLDESGSFVDSTFFPIDGNLFGNQGLSNNFHFTVELHGLVPFSGSERLVAGSDDDLWIFVNGHLAIDIGGLHSVAGGSIDLALPSVQAALGLVPGTPYVLDVFFAERHTVGSWLEIHTVIPEPGTALLVLLGVAGLAARADRMRSMVDRGPLQRAGCSNVRWSVG